MMIQNSYDFNVILFRFVSYFFKLYPSRLIADLEQLSEVASISNSLADVLSSSWLCFSALRLDFEVACFTKCRFTTKAKVGAIGLEQSCKSPSFAKRRKDGCVSEGWPIETQACVV